MDSLIRLQIDIYKKIDRNFVNFQKSPKDRVTYIQTRLDTLEKQWSSFDDVHSKLITEFPQKEFEISDYYLKDVYNVTEDLYTEYKSELLERLSKLQQEGNTPSHVNKECNQNSVKLPRIAIPSFSGSYLEWTTFRDLFLTLIHNNNTLQNVQKLHYLKSYLTGEAEQLLRHLPINNENYLTCWNILENRYNNKKFITDCILRRFFGQRTLTSESYVCLKELFDTTNECLNALKNEGIKTENWDIIVICTVSSKLDSESRKLWEAKACTTSNELPTLKLFLDFLEHRFRSLEFLGNKVVKSTKTLHVLNSNIENKTNCSYCSSYDHKLGNCKEFVKLELSARRNFVQNSGLCYNCLGANHSVTSCRLPTRCRICKKKHHSLLHSVNINLTQINSPDKQSVDNNVVATATTSQDEINITNITTCFSNTTSQVILPTALVNAESSLGSYITLRSLLDQGSQASFITESAVQLLGLRKIQCNSVISGVGGEEDSSFKCNYVVYVNIKSIKDPTFIIQVKAYVLSKLTSFLPDRKIVVQLWPNLPRMKLADPDFNVPSKIDLLLGAEVYCQIITDGLIRGSPGVPIAQNTRLGWVLSGYVGSDSVTNNIANCNSTIITMHTNVYDQEFNLKQPRELESNNFTLNKHQFTQEEKKCEDLFQETNKRDISGRCIEVVHNDFLSVSIPRLELCGAEISNKAKHKTHTEHCTLHSGTQFMLSYIRYENWIFLQFLYRFNLPPAQWLLGKITEEHPGLDKVTRVVTIKCKDSF